MYQSITPLVIALKTVTLVLGALITYFALKAYYRTKSRSLWALAVGFGLTTVGALLAGIADQVLLVDTGLAFTLDNVLTGFGFAVILYSLYIE